MTASESVLERTMRVVEASLDLPDSARPLTAETPLLGEGVGVDSLEILKVVAALEEEFDLEFDDDELTLESFATVETVSLLVDRNLDR